MFFANLRLQKTIEYCNVPVRTFLQRWWAML
jgi:hypothetical protein